MVALQTAPETATTVVVLRQTVVPQTHKVFLMVADS